MLHNGMRKFQRLCAQWLGNKRLGDDLPEAEQLALVSGNPSFIKHIRRPSVTVQLAAVKDDGYNLSYIINPAVKVQLASICNASGVRLLGYHSAEGLLHARKMTAACPALFPTLTMLKETGVWPSSNEQDLILAASALKQAIEGLVPTAPSVTLPDDFDPKA